MLWIKILDANQIQTLVQLNKPIKIKIDTTSIALVWNGQRYFAVQDQCTHNRASLSEGKLNAFEEIICPWHEYRFQLKTGRECAGRAADLRTWQTEKREDGLYLFW
ncbi:MAG: Rieske 2Fe-2S domain-containing protein [Cyclobacteriaceae bacterium]|nr:Rieske 2Fe-2S domain-containing protein [Cyclobacteriaceae bacterium]